MTWHYRAIRSRFLLPRWPVLLFGASALLAAAATTRALQAADWRVLVGAESSRRGNQALAFLPNEMWIHQGDTIQWLFPTHERHTLTLLKPGQTRPPGFGPIFGIVVGCPGTTPDGSSFDGSACVTTGVSMLEDTQTPTDAPTYSVTFPTAGNFKFVCLIHADMTGLVHVLDTAAVLPFDQEFYDRQAAAQGSTLLNEASQLAARHRSSDVGSPTGAVAAGIGAVVTMSGAGSQTASLMRFEQKTVEVRVGDTVEWTNLDPSINHTVTFGAEPADPRPPSAGVSLTLDGARRAVIGSTSDSVNSGFLSPAPQDRANLAQSVPGVTHFRVTFTAPGTFEYICAVHDQLGMAGTVIVR